MARTSSIITTCKGRLDHLKATLPKMIAQGAREVIVVDYSCPERAGEFIAANFPAVRLVSVEGEAHFSNWKARNAGASVATSDLLLFVDADTNLADGALGWLSEHFPEESYGFFDRKTSSSFSQDGPRLASNQLKGFHVIPAAAFRRVGGYDEVLEGYGAGADTDLEERLLRLGLAKHPLDPRIVESVIQHDAASRTQHHAQPIRMSYGAGLLYRAAKRVLLRTGGALELPLPARQQLYAAAMKAMTGLGSEGDRATLEVMLGQDSVMMPRQLGYERGTQTISFRVEVSLEGRLTEIPE